MREQLPDEGRANSVLNLADQLSATPIITTGRAIELLDVTRPTAQRAIDTLVERGDLVEITGFERNRVYEAHTIFDAVYGPATADASADAGQLNVGPHA
jgi:Fic family protein